MTQFDAETKTWSGPKVDRSEDHLLSLRETILKNLRSTPGKVFQISDDEGTELTYAQVENMSIRVAQNLQRFGLQPRDVVTVFFRHSSLVAPLVFGCMLLGAPVNAIITQDKMDEEWIKATLGLSQPKVLILQECIEHHELLMHALLEIGLNPKIFLNKENNGDICTPNVYNVDELFMETNSEKSFALSKNDDIDDSSTFFIISSSGTTGRPKLICLPGFYCKTLKYIFKQQENAVVFAYSSIDWFSGLASLMFQILNKAMRIISNDNKSLKNFGHLVKKYGVTSVKCSNGVMCKMLNAPDFSAVNLCTIKEFLVSGERVPSYAKIILAKKLLKGSFGMVYGTTECGSVTNYDKTNDYSGTENLVGKLNANVKLRVIDLKSRKPLGANEAGEIVVKTESNFTMYQEKPDLTTEAFEDGWYKTSDFGFVNEQGLVFIHGRINDLVSVDGKQFHPAQIEKVFEVEGVKDACVVNLYENDILAVLCTGSAESTITKETLARKAEESFNDMKFLGGIHFVDELPRLPFVLKVSRPEVKKLALKLIDEEALRL